MEIALAVDMRQGSALLLRNRLIRCYRFRCFFSYLLC